MKKFKRIYIEITNQCNLHCVFCPRTCRKTKYMKTDEFRHIVNEIHDYTDYIYFHIKGEPLLHPNLGEFLDISCTKGLKVNITTNGTLMLKAKDKLIGKPALRQVNISLHSLAGNKDLNNRDSYLQSIFDFIREARRKEKNAGIESPIFALRLWNLSKNELDSLNLDRNKDILERIKSQYNIDYDIKDRITWERGIKIGEKLYLNHDTEFIWPQLSNEVFSHKGYCHGLRDQIGILSDGTVIPCCLDGEGVVDLGNIFNTKFEDILAGNRARNIYDGFSKRVIVEELCKKCGFRTRFD